MKGLGSTVRLAVLATLGLGGALLADVPTRTAVDVWVLVLGGAALLLLVRTTREASRGAARSAFDAALAGRPARTERPAELEELERGLYLAVSNAFYLHMRLRPLLREIASSRLREHHGIELERNGVAARALVTPDVWELVRPDAPPPRNRHGPGAPVSELRRAIDALERM